MLIDYSRPFRRFFKGLILEHLRNFSLTLDSENIFQDVNEQLLTFINKDILRRVLISEYYIALKAELVSDLKEFYDLTDEVEYQDYFFEKYEYAKKLLQGVLSNIDRYLIYAINKLIADRESLNEVFGISDYKINELKILHGDLHKDNSFSILIRFGHTLIWFKPKGICSEVWFSDFIDSINRDVKYEIRSFFPKYINRKSYSWVEHIPHSIDDDLIEKYYFTFGQYLALFYLFGSYDIINDNVICHKGVPVFFDLETLFNKDISSKYQESRFKSVLDTGVLPSRAIPSIMKEDGFNGALIPRNNKLYTKSFELSNKTGVKQVEKLIELSPESLDQTHLPFNVAKGQWQTGYSESFIKGFSSCFEDFVLKNKDFIIQKINQLFQKDPIIRKLIRHTVVYSSLLNESLHPFYLKNADSYADFISVLKEYEKGNSIVDTIVESEISQLMKFDIPYFYGLLNNPSLYNGEGRIVVEDYFLENDIDFFSDRIRTVDKREYLLQKNTISKNLSYYEKEIRVNQTAYCLHKVIWKEGGKDDSCPTARQLVDAARLVGDYLMDDLIVDGEKVHFVRETAHGSDAVKNVGVVNNSLYSGKNGIALFFLHLFKVSNNDNFFKVAKAIIEENHKRTYVWDLSLQEDNCGPFIEPFDIIYVCYQYFKITGDDTYIRSTIGYLKEKIEIVLNIENYDFLTGLSGLFSLVVDLYSKGVADKKMVESLKDKITSGYLQIGEKSGSWKSKFLGKLLPTKEPIYLGGFSHGGVGVAFALAKYISHFDSIDNQNVIELINNAINYQNTLYSPQHKNFIDLRDGSVDSKSSYWCHGASGITMAYLEIKKIFELKGLKLSPLLGLEHFSENLIQHSFGSNYVVCHGDMSNIELLYKYGAERHRPEACLKAKEILKKYVDEVSNDRFMSLSNFEPLGLFDGLAGLGYTFLRFSNPKQTPSILTLDL